MGSFVAALLWVGSVTGATLLPQQLAAMQNGNPGLIALPAEIRHWAALKLPRIAHEQPEVVIIGSSRGNEVRSAMLQPYKLYNASLTCWNLEQMLAMVEQLTGTLPPRVIILSLDYFMFSTPYARSVAGERTMYFNNDWKVRYQSTINLLRSAYKYPSFWTKKVPEYLFGRVPPRADGLSFAGLDAIRAEAGFRWDGSFRYEAGTLAIAPQRTAANKGLIDAMPGGPAIDRPQWAVLERIAALAQKRRVKLIAIQWPILKASLDYLNDNPDYHPLAGMWREFRSDDTSAKLRALGIEFYDLSSLDQNEDSRNFIDAAHANESGMLNAVLALTADPAFRATFPLIDTAALLAARIESTEKGEFANIYNQRFQ